MIETIQRLERRLGLDNVPIFESPSWQIVEEPSIDHLRKVATSKAALEREG